MNVKCANEETQRPIAPVAKRTGEHAQIEKRLKIHVLPDVFAYQNKKFVASQWSQVNFLAYYGSTNQSTFTKF
jgi:hypothetical protein